MRAFLRLKTGKNVPYPLGEAKLNHKKISHLTDHALMRICS